MCDCSDKSSAVTTFWTNHGPVLALDSVILCFDQTPFLYLLIQRIMLEDYLHTSKPPGILSTVSLSQQEQRHRAENSVPLWVGLI